MNCPFRIVHILWTFLRTCMYAQLHVCTCTWTHVQYMYSCTCPSVRWWVACPYLYLTWEMVVSRSLWSNQLVSCWIVQCLLCRYCVCSFVCVWLGSLSESHVYVPVYVQMYMYMQNVTGSSLTWGSSSLRKRGLSSGVHVVALLCPVTVHVHESTRHLLSLARQSQWARSGWRHGGCSLAFPSFCHPAPLDLHWSVVNLICGHDYTYMYVHVHILYTCTHVCVCACLVC